MTSAASHDRDGVLVLAPNGRDGLVIRDLLQRDGFDVEICADVEALLQAIPRACVVVLADEALRTLKARNALREWIDAQPSWSDFPFVLLTSRQSAVDDRNSSTGELLGNATLLERPLHPITLASAVRQAIRARRRQRAP
jgi:DNA-binding response OmpR family regulator